MRMKMIDGKRKRINEGGIPVYLRARMDEEDKEEFKAICAELALNPSEVLRKLIRDFVDRGGVIE